MRGIELGGISKSVAVATTPSIGRGISAGFKIGGFPAPRFEMGIKNIANPFTGVEAKTPPQTRSVGPTSLPSGPEAVRIAEEWLRSPSQPQKSHYILDREDNGIKLQRVIRASARPADLVWTRPEVLAFPNPEPVVKAKNELKMQPSMGKIELSKSAPASSILTQLNTRSVQENAVEQNLTEEVLVKEKTDQKPEILQTEEIEELKLKDILDEKVAEQRVYEISEAIDLAEAEAKAEGVKEISGPRILKFIHLHIGLISRIARKLRKDGSLDETLKELSARRFRSSSEAKKQTKELVAQKEPVKRGKEGRAVKEGAVERVFKYHLIKRSPNEEVVGRVVKKQVVQTGNAKVIQFMAVEPAIKERTIEDAGLAEVFKKAA